MYVYVWVAIHVTTLPNRLWDAIPKRYQFTMQQAPVHIDHIYTFDTQKKDLPKALESVPVQTICCWEHHCHQMYWWTEAYRGNLGTQDAQFMVQKISSTKYTSY